MSSKDLQRSRKTRLVNIFMDTLICNVRYADRYVSDNPVTIILLAMVHLSCSFGTMPPRILSFESPGSSRRRHQSNVPGITAASAKNCEEGYSCSPYPLVDKFINSCVSRGGVQGGIRRWSYFQQGTLNRSYYDDYIHIGND